MYLNKITKPPTTSPITNTLQIQTCQIPIKYNTPIIFYFFFTYAKARNAANKRKPTNSYYIQITLGKSPTLISPTLPVLDAQLTNL